MNSLTTIEVTMNSLEVNVSCAKLNKEIIGRHFSEDETVNRQNYLQMLKNYFYPIMQRERLNNKMSLQEDGALPHFSKEIRT